MCAKCHQSRKEIAVLIYINVYYIRTYLHTKQCMVAIFCQPTIVQTMPSPQAATSPKVATSREGLSASFSSATRPHSYGAKGGTNSSPSSSQHMQMHDFQSKSKPHLNHPHSLHVSMHTSSSSIGLDAKTDKRHSLGREGEGKEVEAAVTKQPSFKHQTSQEALNALKKHKEHFMFNIRG